MEWVARAWIGLGANLGNPREALANALLALHAMPRTRVVAVSSLYRSAPVDADGPDYLNAVAALDTVLSAPELLTALHSIEEAAGRSRPYRNAPRLLDLDLLLHGEFRCATPSLHLPHPRMQARAFVLAPLAELAPTLRVPGQGTVTTLLAAVENQRVERLPDENDWPGLQGPVRHPPVPPPCRVDR